MKISTRVANYITTSPKLQKALLKIDKNPSLFNAAYTAGLAITLKPASIMAMAINTKDGKEDAKYASAKSISTGILDFAIALAIFVPLNKRLNKISEKLFDKADSIYYKDKQMCLNYKSVMNRFIKIATLPIFAILKFGAIEPVVKYLFKKRADENNK